MFRHQECRVVNFWRPPALPEQGKRIKLQRVVYTNWWKQHTTTVLLRTLLARMFSVLKKGTRNAHLAVHSSACGILSCLWSWLCLHWFVPFREGDFGLYREALAELLPYFFASNEVNYARWLTIHLRAMRNLCGAQNREEIFRTAYWSCPRTE